MATMYPLFFGVLFIAVCGNVGTVHHPVDTRQKIVNIASGEIGVREATGNNDGDKVESYLRYTDLGKGYAWCAAFASWCYGQAGLPEPRNPWSPALVPNARTYCRSDAFRQVNGLGVGGQPSKRTTHVRQCH